VATKVGQFDRPPLTIGKTAERLANLVGNDDVPHLALDVVACVGRFPCLALLAPPPGHF
jgi:hypothetical protein